MTSGFKHKRLFLYFLLTAAAFLLFFTDGNVFGSFVDYRWRDLLFWMRGPEPVDERIIICTIDEDSFEALEKDLPFDQKIYINFFDNLKKLEAGVIGLDFIISESYKNEFSTDDVALKKSIQNLNSIVFAAKFENYFKNEKLGGQEISSIGIKYKMSNRFFSESGRTGLINAALDQDGTMRNSRLFFKSPIDGETKETFIFKLYEAFFDRLKDSEKKNYMAPSKLALERNNFIINYAGGPKHFNEVPFYSFAMMPPESIEKLKSRYKDKIIIVGPSYYESHDFFSVPFSNSQYVKGYNLMAGVEVIANALNTIIKNKFITAAQRNEFIFIYTSFAVLSIIIFGLFSNFFVNLFFYAAQVLSILYISYHYFINKLSFMDISTLISMITIIYFISAAYKIFVIESEKKAIKSTLERYVSQNIVDTILNHGESINMAGSDIDAAILFADIRSFTSLSEKLPAENIVKILNLVFKKMVDVIFANNGTLDKFIGDCVMVIFGAPQKSKMPIKQAITCALEMQKAAREFNREYAEELSKLCAPAFNDHNNKGEIKISEISIGIGINFGRCAVGNIGSEKRLEYTAIGDTVNIASRIQSLAGGGEIIITEDLYEALYKNENEYFNAIKNDIIKLEPVHLKGRETPVLIYKLQNRPLIS